MALTDKLVAIGDAIREKTGTTELIPLVDMPTVIRGIETGGGSGEGIPEEALTITGDCYFRFAYNGWNWFIENYGDKITTVNIDRTYSMFQGSTELEYIPFDINHSIKNGVYGYHIAGYLFADCNNLKNVPKSYNFRPNQFSYMFSNCHRLREIPDDYADCIDWSYLDSRTSAFEGGTDNIFNSCYSLRKAPMGILKHGNPVAYSSYTIYYSLFNNCYSLDEVVGLPFPHSAGYTTNIFYNTFGNCDRLKRFTFEKQADGSPYVANWTNQTIDLTKVGYASGGIMDRHRCTKYNSGITTAKMVSDDAQYEALKDDPDWYGTTTDYCRYNRESAFETISSLPDTTAYIAANGGTNIIKFTGASGAKTDGGAISDLTDAEIVYAAARGWTVSIV